MSQTSIYTRLLLGLAGHSRNGLRLQQIADGITESPSTTLRNLQRLEEVLATLEEARNQTSTQFEILRNNELLQEIT